jgi:hypothetical protein
MAGPESSAAAVTWAGIWRLAKEQEPPSDGSRNYLTQPTQMFQTFFVFQIWRLSSSALNNPASATTTQLAGQGSGGPALSR